MSEEVFHATIITLSGALVAGLCWLMTKASAYLTSHVKNQQVGMLLVRVSDLAQRVVKDVYQSTVGPFQANDNWNAETQAVAKAQALAKLKSYIGLEGLKMLEYLAGMGGKQTLDEFLGTYVESAVVDAKAAGAVASSSRQVVVSTAAAPATQSSAKAPSVNPT